MKGIDPKYVMWLGLLVTIEQAIGHGTVSLTNLVPADWAPYITSWCNFLAFIGTAIMTYQASVSSTQAGPMINTPIAPVAKVIVFAFLLSAVLIPSAFAQARKPAMTGNIMNDLKLDAAPAASADKCQIPWDPLKLCGALTGKPEEDMQRVIKRIQSIGRDDMNYAILKATTANTNGSKVRLQCLNAIMDAKNAAEGTGIKDAAGNVAVRPDPAVVTTIEDVAELVDALSPQGPLMTGCAGAAQLFKTNTLAVVNAFVTGAVAIAAAPVGL